MTECKVRFLPGKEKIVVPNGTDLLAAAMKAGIILSAACGGEGICGKCKVVIDGRERLACQTIVERDMEVLVPPSSLEDKKVVGHEAEEFTGGVILDDEKRLRFSPLVGKIYLELSRPTGDDVESDLERIYRAIEKQEHALRVSTRLANVKHLGDIIRDAEFKVTAVVAFKEDSIELLSIEPGDTRKKLYGFAFDIGTTTVAGQLVDLAKNGILGTRIAFNRQSVYGSDVITRIIHGSTPDGLKQLQDAVIGNVNEIIEDLSSSCRVNLGDAYAVTFAGNTTMTHVLLGIDPSHIRKVPYIPTTTTFEPMPSSELGIELNPKAIAYMLPGVAAYVGGDIVSGLLACGLPNVGELSALIDIGTNGEIVIGDKEWMIGAAASAGPAFEGSGLSCGMKATSGAINMAKIDHLGHAKIETIGGARPKGICGSGYIDILCEMLKNKIIGKDGKLERPFIVCPAAKSATGKDIRIDNDDIENLKRSKGAIYSAIVALLHKVDKDLKDLKRIYIAGGFGNYLNIENAIYIGLLPDLDRSVYKFIGNSSLSGARMSLVSRDAMRKTGDIHKKVTYVDLSSEPRYMDEYIASLFFPHTDLGRFPSVR